MRQDLNGNAAGALLVVWLALVHVIVWYPAEILDAAAGYVFGFGVGFPLVIGSWIVSGLASYAVGRHFARPAPLPGRRARSASSALERPDPPRWRAIAADRRSA